MPLAVGSTYQGSSQPAMSRTRATLASIQVREAPSPLPAGVAARGISASPGTSSSMSSGSGALGATRMVSSSSAARFKVASIAASRGPGARSSDDPLGAVGSGTVGDPHPQQPGGLERQHQDEDGEDDDQRP